MMHVLRNPFLCENRRSALPRVGTVGGAGLLVGLILMFVSTAPVAAQIPPQAINQPCTACEPQAIHVADLNDDGAPDVLSVSQFDDKLAWYENTGGGYGQQQVISTALTSNNGTSDQSVTAADVDGDGDLDVIAGSGPDEKAVWFENKIDAGSGFGPARDITTSDGKVFAVAAAQIDGDGKADVVLGTGGSGVIWFESQVGESGSDFGNVNVIASPLSTSCATCAKYAHRLESKLL